MRIVLIIAASLIAALAHAAPVSKTIPPARSQPYVEERYNIRIDDPYRWMEAFSANAEVTEWLKQASEYSMAQLATLPKHAAFAAQLEQTTRTGVKYTSAQSAHGKLFYMARDPQDQRARLMVRSNGVDRILLDPAKVAEGGAINNYSISPDGSMAAVHIGQNGSEVGEVYFIEVETGVQKGKPLGPIWGEFEIHWLKGNTIAYTGISNTQAGADPLLNMVGAVTTIGQGGGTPVFGATVPGSPKAEPHDLPRIYTSPLSDWAWSRLASAGRTKEIFFIHNNALVQKRPEWRKLKSYQDRISDVTLRGNELYLLSYSNNPGGEIVSYDMASDRIRKVSLPNQGGLILEDIKAVRNGLYIIGQQDGVGQLLFLPDKGDPGQKINLPYAGSIADAQIDGDGNSIVFSLSGWFQPRSFFRAEGAKISALNLASAGWDGAKAFSSVKEEAKSADGTMVPMTILLPPGGIAAGPRPVILYGYGSYRISTDEPGYSPGYMAWLAQGGIIAECGTRGGSERGGAWHEAGRGVNKPNGHADYIACAERLTEAGYTKPGKIIGTGTSAGGILVIPAALKRSELFAALIARVSIMNPSRYEAARNGPNQYAEFGDPHTEAGFKSLLAQDSYVKIGEAADMPDMLITVGLNDNRVEPWMQAKFAARALERFGDRKQILVRADDKAGHGVGSAQSQINAEYTDLFAYAWEKATAD